MQLQARIRLILLTGVVGMLLVAWLPPSGFALPPRPTSHPPVTRSPKPPNGAIELTVEPVSGGLWTVVQWQDALGGWHDVEGWQGTLGADGKKTWWVDSADRGRGPFRWIVTQDGDFLTTSASFYLPHSAGQIVRISLSLVP